MKKLSSFLPWIIALVVSCIISLAYFPETLSGKGILQHDIIQYSGGSEETKAFRIQTNTESYWTNSMFGGMPNFQSGAQFSGYWIQKIDGTLRFLPRPADYWFLALMGGFMLGMAVFKRWYYAIALSIFFAFCSYFFIVVEAGHNAKMHAIAYFPALMAGVFWLYQKQWFKGFIATSLFGALELFGGHPQMTYYFAFGLLFFTLNEAFFSVKERQVVSFIKSSALGILAGILALGMNLPKYLPTIEFTKHTTRGNNDLNPKQNGLQYDYITDWSYGIAETMNLWVPNLMGGSSQMAAREKPNTYQAIIDQGQPDEIAQQFTQQLPAYWGEQPMTSGPAYQGALVILLFLLGMIVIPHRYKWWILLSVLWSIAMAWGKSFESFTKLLIAYMPGYNKFRAVSSALVLAEFFMPLGAAMGLYYFIKSPLNEKKKINLLGSLLVFTTVVFLLTFSFALNSNKIGVIRMENAPFWLKEALISDRLILLKNDLWRTYAFVILALGLLILYTKNILKNKIILIVLLSGLSLLDTWIIGKRYLNTSSFVSKEIIQNPFPVDESMSILAENDKEIERFQLANIHKVLFKLKQKDASHYRVFNLAINPFNENTTSYFHQSIGGYNGAKLGIYQNLIETYFSRQQPQQNVMDMMNVKYLVVPNDITGVQIIQNPSANGNAWFVDSVIPVKSSKEALLLLGKINTKTTALVQHAIPLQPTQKEKGIIQLDQYLPNHLTYQSQSPEKRLGVFSEIYYSDGWNATIDGKKAPILRVNYALRGLVIPSGTHTIVMEFVPKSVEHGATAGKIFFIIWSIVILIGVFIMYKKHGPTKD